MPQHPHTLSPCFREFNAKSGLLASSTLHCPSSLTHILFSLLPMSILNICCAQLQFQPLCLFGETNITFLYQTKVELTTDHRRQAFLFSSGRQGLYFAEGRNMLLFNTCNILKYTSRSNSASTSSFFLVQQHRASQALSLTWCTSRALKRTPKDTL